MTFTISETRFGSLPALIVDGDGTTAVVALRGATLLSWTVGGTELIDGYLTEQEFVDQAGMRSAIMVPFSNRIRHGRYAFDDHEVDFHDSDPEHSGETVMHGLLRDVDFTVEEKLAGESSATVRFVTSALRPGAFSGYPFSVDVTVEMTFFTAGIEIAIVGTNVGDTAAPFTVGWHPYFRVGEAKLDSLVLKVPAATRIVSDADLIPLDGSAAFEPVSGTFDLREPCTVNGLVLDTALSDLELRPDGRAHTTLTDPATNRTIDVWQERGLMYVFTADIDPRQRAALAMEPVEVMTNAFNRPDQADAIRLEPQQHRTFRFGVSTTLETE